MHFEYSLTKEDVVSFNYYTNWASPEKKNFRIQQYGKVFMYAFAGGLLLFAIDNPENKLQFFVIMGIWVLVSGTFMSYHIFHVRYREKLMNETADENNSSWFQQLSLIFSDEGIISKTETSEGFIKWAAIIKKVETSEYFYLFMTSYQAFVIPKRIMDQKQLGEFHEMLSRNVSLKSEFDHLVFNQR